MPITRVHMVSIVKHRWTSILHPRTYCVSNGNSSWKQQLEFAVSHMDRIWGDAYMALANSHKEDGSGPLFGVQRTNGFALNGERIDVTRILLLDAVPHNARSQSARISPTLTPTYTCPQPSVANNSSLMASPACAPRLPAPHQNRTSSAEVPAITPRY